MLRLRQLLPLLKIFFAPRAEIMLENIALRHHSLESAKRLFGLARFRYYAIADGIKEILSGRLKQVFNFDGQETADIHQPDFVDMLGLPAG